MKQHSVEAIEAEVRKIWIAEAKDEYYGKIDEVEVSVDEGTVSITLSNMYEAPGLSFGHLMKLAEFFGTKNINDDDRFSFGGCETCDYGSSYGFTLTVRPEKKG